jgi:hypothetical protein
MRLKQTCQKKVVGKRMAWRISRKREISPAYLSSSFFFRVRRLSGGDSQFREAIQIH